MLDFSFSFAGQTWDETDVSVCDCAFFSNGEPLSVNFSFSDASTSWFLGFQV